MEAVHVRHLSRWVAHPPSHPWHLVIGLECTKSVREWWEWWGTHALNAMFAMCLESFMTTNLVRMMPLLNSFLVTCRSWRLAKSRPL
jgi:hypothetical protein